MCLLMLARWIRLAATASERLHTVQFFDSMQKWISRTGSRAVLPETQYFGRQIAGSSWMCQTAHQVLPKCIKAVAKWGQQAPGPREDFGPILKKTLPYFTSLVKWLSFCPLVAEFRRGIYRSFEKNRRFCFYCIHWSQRKACHSEALITNVLSKLPDVTSKSLISYVNRTCSNHILVFRTVYRH